MSFRKRMTWLICSGLLAVTLSDHARAFRHEERSYGPDPAPAHYQPALAL